MQRQTIKQEPSGPESGPSIIMGPRGGVYTPLLISLTTGLITFAFSVVVMNKAGVMDPWGWGAIIGLGSILLVWAVSIRRWFEYAYSAFIGYAETLTGLDLDGNDNIGNQPLPPREILYKVQDAEGGQFKQINYKLPYPGLHKALADHILGGGDYSEGQLTRGHRALFTRSQFTDLREALLKRDLLAWRDPGQKRQGVAFTDAGLDLLRRIAENPPTPDA